MKAWENKATWFIVWLVAVCKDGGAGPCYTYVCKWYWYTLSVTPMHIIVLCPAHMSSGAHERVEGRQAASINLCMGGLVGVQLLL